MLLETHLALYLVKVLEGMLPLRLRQLGPELDDQLVVREDVGQKRLVRQEEVQLVPLQLVQVIVVLDVHCSLEDRAQTLSECEVGLVPVYQMVLVVAGLHVAWVVAAHVCIVGLRDLLYALPGA
jgi:hypothetical protein